MSNSNFKPELEKGEEENRKDKIICYITDKEKKKNIK